MDVKLVASSVLFEPVLRIICEELNWYVETSFHGVICRCTGILSHNILRICAFAHKAHNVVDRLLTVVFRIFLRAFCIVASHVMLDFVSRSSKAWNGASLRVASAMGKSGLECSQRGPCACFAFCSMLELVAEAPISDCGVSVAWSDDIFRYPICINRQGSCFG